MKIDMHCHVFGGSIDSIITLKKTVKILKNKGFDGMVVTDHNSYKGFKDYNFDNFTVILGIEYDTCDAGHILIILPNSIFKDCRFEKRGMTLCEVSKITKSLGGVLGVAHPYAHGKFGLAWHINENSINKDYAMSLVDFIEVFNGTVPNECNKRSKDLAKDYSKVGTAGSDSHRKSTIGLCGTVFSNSIKDNDDIIEAILNNKVESIEEGYSKLSKARWYRFLFSLCENLYYCYHKFKCKCKK